MRRAALLLFLCLAAFVISGCASKPAAAGSQDKVSEEKPGEAGNGAASDGTASASGETNGTAEDPSPIPATADDAIEPPPPPPTFVFAPDEPTLSETAKPSEEAASEAAAPAVVPPAPAPAKAVPPAAKEKPKSAAKPKAAAPVLRPAEEKPVPSPPRETVPVPAAGMPELPSRSLPSAEEAPVAYSRTVRATVGQLVEIPFRGAGWVYLGELTAKKGLPYDSRRLDAEGQSFVFRAEAVGTYGLKFFREDFLADSILNDYVQVVVGEGVGGSALGGFSVPLDRGRVVAEPRWPPVAAAPAPATRRADTSAPVSVPPATTSGAVSASAESSPLGATGGSGTTPSAAAASAPTISPPTTAAAVPPMSTPMGGTASAATITPPTATAAAPATGVAASATGAAQGQADPLGPDALPEAYLSIVKTEADAGRTASALAVLDRFRDKFPSGSDEAWWLYGRLLETNGPAKDVKAALGFYKRLVAEYPQSSRYDEARRRIAYLERYYFQIR